MQELVIIQHCQSEHHVNELTGGWTDTSLTHLGRRQAYNISERLETLKSIHEFRIISSDLIRTRETAEIINLKLKLPLTSDNRLR